MQFSNTLSLAVALLASSTIALPFRDPSHGPETSTTSGAGAAGSKCSEEGRVVCVEKQFQVCASGSWSVSMSLAQGTDCSVFGTSENAGNGTLPSNPNTIPVSPVSAPTSAVAAGSTSAVIPSIPIPTATPSAPASSAVSSADASEPTGFAGHQTYSEPSFPVPTLSTSSVAASSAAPSQPAATGSSTTQPTGGSSSGGSTTPQPSQHYTGSASDFPGEDKWVSFDTMWNLNSKVCNGPQNDGKGDVIKQDIQKVSSESGVDARIILAVILQESTCLLGVPSTNGGVNNPGIMQSHNGVSYDGTDGSILQMIKDGVEGTDEDGGEGIMQYIKQDGLYVGLRAYNSGPNGVDKSNLEALPAGTGTASYCNDIANRLTGAKVESQ